MNLCPNNSDYLFDLATAYEKTANYDRAKELFARVTEVDPSELKRCWRWGA